MARGPRAALAALSFTIALAIPATASRAQMPSLPVLQSGFAGGGVTFAVNYGAMTGSNAYAVAAGWGPATGRFQVSGALGGVRPDSGSTWTGYGLRAAVPLYTSARRRVGVTVFGGVGGARRDTTSLVRVPVGLGAGYRIPLGATRSLTAYGAPFFVWSRLSERGSRATGKNGMRGSVAADLVLTAHVALTAGYDFGATTADLSGSGSAGVFGAAVSYAFR